MSFFESQFIKNLEKGELPVIKTEVTIDNESLLNLLAGILVLIVLAFFAYKFIIKGGKS